MLPILLLVGLALGAGNVGNLKLNGNDNTWSIVEAWANGMKADGKTVYMPYNTRGYLVPGTPGSISPGIFGGLPLLGESFGFTMDIRDVGCGCNAAVYLVLMPGYDSNQQPAPSDGGDYYCDANQVGGVWCPEMDLAEANNQAIQVTPHKCDNPSGLHYYNCDKGGCSHNFPHEDGSAYGNGNWFAINTQQPFKMNFTFQASGGNLVDIVTVISQGSNSRTMHHSSCPGGYLSAMSAALSKGMTVVFSSWGGGMGWLDSPPCNGDQPCNPASWSVYDFFTTSKGPTPSKCTMEPGIDYVGNDMGNSSQPGADACCNSCTGTSGCAGFSFKAENGQCYLKYAIGDRKNDGGIISGKKN